MAKLAATTYAGLDAFLGSKTSRTIGNNTTAARYGDEIVVRLHGNRIVRLSATEVEVFDAGWPSVTTKERLNQFLPVGYRIVSKNFRWMVLSDDGPDWAWNGSATFPRYGD